MRELWERDAELAALHAALAEAMAGSGSVVVVDGEAGIGKSSLLRAFLADVPRGVRVLAGGCDDLLAARPLAPLREAALGVPGPLAGALDGPATDVFDAAVAQLSAGPSLLAVDDIQWADDATLDVLRLLARRIAHLPALLVLAVRKEGVGPGHPAQALLGSLAGRPVVHLDLSPLSPAAVAAMAGDRDAAALHRVTGGNPFFVTEALAVPPGELPDSVADAVHVRVGRLPAETVAALENLSVVPTPLDPELTKALLGDQLATLAEAEERGVVEVRADGALAFRHELARRAMEATLPPLRRRALHAAVVTALREVGTGVGTVDAERLVHHAAAAGDAGTVLEFAPAAARAAAAGGSHRQALAHLEAAAVYADRLDPDERAQLLGDLGWQLYIGERFSEAVATGRRAVALCAELRRPELEAGLTLRLSRYLLLCGEVTEAEQLYERAAALLDGHGSPADRATLAGHGGAVLVMTGRLAEAGPQLRAAAALAAQAGRPDQQSLAVTYLGMVRAEAGELAAGEADVRDALAMARRHRCDESAARIYTNLVDMLYVFGDWTALDAAVTEGHQFCEERGLIQFSMLLDMQRHQLRMRAGDWDAAEHGLRELASRGRDVGGFIPRIEAWLGRLLVRRGAPEGAGLVRRAWREACRQRHPITLVYAGLAMAEWAWLSGSAAAADEAAAVLLPKLTSPAWATPHGELTRHLQRAGLPTEPFDECPHGYAAGLRGDWRAAAAAAERSGDPYERALELGFSGEPRAMVRGWEALDALGAAAAPLVRQALREHGVTRLPARPRRDALADRPGLATMLTQRQLDVLDLLARGATNAEIAGRLVLSVRTVDHHVSAILARLGARSRREAAAMAQTTGRATVAT